MPTMGKIFVDRCSRDMLLQNHLCWFDGLSEIELGLLDGPAVTMEVLANRGSDMP
jgi:hypothetical protein